MAAQMESSLTKADSEQLARSVIEEQYSLLEKEKIMKELEIKDMLARHKQELGEKDATISSVRSRHMESVKSFSLYKVRTLKEELTFTTTVIII